MGTRRCGGRPDGAAGGPAPRWAAGIPEHLFFRCLQAGSRRGGGRGPERRSRAPWAQAPSQPGSGRARRQGWGGAAGRAGAGAGQGQAGLLRGRRSPRSPALAPKLCGARAMRTLWMALCALARLWPGALAGCADAGRCCPGRDPACFAHGWRQDRVYGTCFCDQACRLTGDCCFDYSRACPGGWRARGWATGRSPAAEGHRVPHQGPQPGSKVSRCRLSRPTLDASIQGPPAPPSLGAPQTLHPRVPSPLHLGISQSSPSRPTAPMPPFPPEPGWKGLEPCCLEGCWPPRPNEPLRLGAAAW